MVSLTQKIRSRQGYRWLVVVSGLVALALYLYSSSTGLAGTGDTYYYLYAAQTLRQKGQLLMPDGSPYQAWPPLFATILAATGAPAPVRWLNGLSLLGALAAWSATGYQLLPPKRAWVLPLLLALSSPALVVSKFIWSESVFNVLWAAYFLALLAWLQQGKWRWGLLATTLGCLLPLQRLAGLFLLAGVGVGLLWPGTGRLVRPGRWAQLGHLAGVGSGFLLWQLHSWPYSTLSNMAPPPTYPGQLSAVAAEYSFVLERWLVPLPATSLRLLPTAVWLVGLLLVLLALWPRKQAMMATWALLSTRMLFVGLLVTLVLLVAGTMVGRVGYDGLYEAERFLTPLYPAVLLLVLLAWPGTTRWSRQLGPGLLIAWVLYQSIRVGRNAYWLHELPPAATTLHKRQTMMGKCETCGDFPETMGSTNK